MVVRDVDLKTLTEFIAKAHRNTYAAPQDVRNAHKLSTPFLPGHKCYHFREGSWEYFDGYAGSAWAPGREVVLLAGTPVWAMSYQGKPADTVERAFSPKFLEGHVFPFLKSALRLAPLDMPFRGPAHFEEGHFAYSFDIHGDARYFTGREVVTHRGKEAFFQDVMGSLIR